MSLASSLIFRWGWSHGIILVLFLTGCGAPSSTHSDIKSLGADLEQRGHPRLRTTASVPTEAIPPAVSLADGLSEDEAVAIALWNNAAFQENLSQLGLARADLMQAGLLANPGFSLLFPVGPKQLEFTATLPFEALWLRPKRIAIAEIETERIAKSLVQDGLNLVRDVKTVWSDLGLAVEREDLGAKMVEVREQISTIANTRLRLRDISELDAMAAQVELERARDEARRWRHEKVVARQRLAALLGWPTQNEVVLFSELPATLPLVAALEAKALAARPDLRATELALEAAGKRAGLAQSEVSTLAGIIDANAKGTDGFEIGPGVSLPLPLFNRNQPAQIRAGAELDRAGWNYLGVRQRIVAEVREAHLRVEEAAAGLAACEQRVLPPMEELVRATRAAFELGEVSPLSVQENDRQLLLARLRRAELRAELRRAWAELERSVGVAPKYFVSESANTP